MPIVGVDGRPNQECASININGDVISTEEAFTVGWEGPHNTMRSWAMNSREDLSEWIHNQGHPPVPVEAHISAVGCKNAF